MDRPGSLVSPLRVPGFAALAAAYTINELGNWLGDIALAVLVFDETGSALATAALFIGTRFLPALLAPLLVTRVERLRPRVALPLLYGIEAIVFVALALVADNFVLAAVVGLGVLDGTFALAGRALTRASAAALLNPTGQLRRGNAVLNFGFTTAGAVGPALGGIVVASAGVSTALLLDAASFAVVAALLASTVALPPAEPGDGSWRARIREAFAYVRERRLVGQLLAAQAAAFLFFAAVIPVEVVYAKETLGTGDAGFGVFLAAWGLGMIAGSVVFAGAHRARIEVLLAVGTAAVGVAYIGIAVAPNLALACAAAAVGGTGNGIQWVALVSAIQELTSSGMQARVLSLLESVASAIPAVGFLAGGALAYWLDPRAAYLVAGVGVLVTLAASAFLMRRAPWPSRGETGPDEHVGAPAAGRAGAHPEG